ncbi:MAG: glycerate kinase [Promethearchaeota archaeon]
MFIKNTSQLLSGNLDKSQRYLREIGLNCLEKALNAVKPKNLIANSVKVRDAKLIIYDEIFNLNRFHKIIIIGGGKASAEMAYALETLMINGPIDIEGIINIPEGLNIKDSEKTHKIELNYATHPIPNENGVYGTKKMLNYIKNSSKEDLIICLISGGGSALLPLPKEGISLMDLQDVNSLLLASGASIHEINAVRKHLSDFKGGNLAKILFNSSNATLISLIISDVIGDNLDTIASGPTVPDQTTFKDAIDIIKKYGIYFKVPKSIINSLEQGFSDNSLENPKTNHPCFKSIHNYLIGSVKTAVQEIITSLKQDFITNYFSDNIMGEARDFGKKLNSIISERMNKNEFENLQKNVALIGTGELTVTIKGTGTGGRNQEMLLSFLDFLDNKELKDNFLIIAANLDGIEGNSKAMGALVDSFILKQIAERKLNTKEYLDNNDSNSFFKIINSEIITGPTGCNVNDLILILISKKT